MPEWSPELEVDERLAMRLIADQFPSLTEAPVRFLAAGWDNTVFVVDERWAFRFPRREVAIPGINREIAVLPSLAPRLPLPIPAPCFVGAPSSAYGWPFFGAPLIIGDEPSPQLTDRARARLAPALGRFLRSLHGLETALDLPHDPLGRADMARRVPFAVERLDALAVSGLADHRERARVLLDDARDLPPSERTALVHGDLHFRHLLVGDTGALAGVIDWGDVCRGDPAMDLQVAWSLLPPDARSAFWAAYGPIDPDQVLRARVVALFLGAVLALYGAAEGLPLVRDEALASLERTLNG